MKQLRRQLGVTLASLMTALSLSSHMRLSAAEEVPTLDPNAQQVDTPPAAEPVPAVEAAPTDKKTPLLNGEIERSHHRQDNVLFRAALKKLAGREAMTSQDYRDLGVGIMGCETYEIPGEPLARVDGVMPGSPAEQAGIHVGDYKVLDNEHRQQVKKLHHDVYAFFGGKAGTKEDWTFLRDGKAFTVTMTRMNIEDIPDAKLRHQYEEWADKLGPSGYVLLSKAGQPSSDQNLDDAGQ
jgi:C-terminal processing protease CtpA/Prc